MAEILNANQIPAHLCVATEYGSAVMPDLPCITLHEGRLDEAGMRSLYKELGTNLIVDATHPYAALVTDTIQKSVEDLPIRYLRLLRPEDKIREEDFVQCYDSIEDCIESLKKTTGNIFLTTGSKELSNFCSDPGVKERITARVLPGVESIQLCLDLGLAHSQIVAMQGPFSQEMNRAMLLQYNSRHLVTKDSGRVGGVDAKILAAKELGITLHLIRRPKQEAFIDRQMGMQEVLDILADVLQRPIHKKTLLITLAGVGCGLKDTTTPEVSRAIAQADVIYGAPRLLENIGGGAKRYPYYRKEEILPSLQTLQQHPTVNQAVVLFSGDSGFYSGCEKLYRALKEELNCRIRILPGISSLQLFASRLGISWQDAKLFSLHGKNKQEWLPILLDSACHNEKTLFLTSGAEDLQVIRQKVQERKELSLYYGYNLSYPDEQIEEVTEQTPPLTKKGLYVGFLYNRTPWKKDLLPLLKDEDFLRDRVPMTKEEIRKLSLCQLQLKEGDILYDIGAGTGSIGLQAALLSPKVFVYAIECDPKAIALIKKNTDHLSVHNYRVIHNRAPRGLAELPAADAAFIGGSRGDLLPILSSLQQINPRMRVVINAVSLESIAEISEVIRDFPVKDLTVTQVAVNRMKELGDHHLFEANNPVYITAFTFA